LGLVNFFAFAAINCPPSLILTMQMLGSKRLLAISFQ